MKKDLKLEIMRIIACMMVILIHVSASAYTKYDVGSYKWHIFNAYDSLSRAAVPIFVMISGILLLDKEKKLSIKKIYTKYIPKMVILLIIWSIIYTLWRLYVLKNLAFTPRDIVNDILTGPFHLWYISVIIFLYIGTPIIREITKSDNSKIPKYCFWIFFMSSFLITLKSCTTIPFHYYIKQALDKIYLDNIFYWYSYFLLGYYIYKTNYLDKYKKMMYILGFVGLISCLSLTAYYSIKANNTILDFYNNFSFDVFCMSVALIYLTKNIKPKEKSRKVIELFSSTTLGIYLIHMIVFQFITEVRKFDIASSSILYTIPLISIAVFLISFVLVLLYKKISRIIIKIFQDIKRTRKLSSY